MRLDVFSEPRADGNRQSDSARTFMDTYQEYRFEGLKPIDRSQSVPNTIPKELIAEAILLRREVPRRSISQIIEILEMEGKAQVSFLKRTTLQDNLQAEGCSTRQMKMYHGGGIAARRFQRQERGYMWHSDIKFGPFLNIGKKQIYLVSFLDDATRYVVHGEFYDSLEQTVVEDCFLRYTWNKATVRKTVQSGTHW